MQLIALQSAPAGQNRAQHKTTTQTPPNLSNCTSSLGLFVSLCFPLKMWGRPIKREEMRQQTCNKNETSFPWRIIFKPKQNRFFFYSSTAVVFYDHTAYHRWLLPSWFVHSSCVQHLFSHICAVFIISLPTVDSFFHFKMHFWVTSFNIELLRLI